VLCNIVLFVVLIVLFVVLIVLFVVLIVLFVVLIVLQCAGVCSANCAAVCWRL